MIDVYYSRASNRISKKAKSILTTVYAVTAAVISYAPHILAITKYYGLPGLFASGHSVPLLKMGTHTVLAGLCLYVAITIGLAILMALVVSLIAKKTGNIVSTIRISFLELLIPAAVLLIL